MTWARPTERAPSVAHLAPLPRAGGGTTMVRAAASTTTPCPTRRRAGSGPLNICCLTSGAVGIEPSGNRSGSRSRGPHPRCRADSRASGRPGKRDVSGLRSALSRLFRRRPAAAAEPDARAQSCLEPPPRPSTPKGRARRPRTNQGAQDTMMTGSHAVLWCGPLQGRDARRHLLHRRPSSSVLEGYQ